jgi:ArsR family metal-binding transcriptional regulator
MNKFFVPKKIYEDRIAICKDCVYYFSPTGNCTHCGCFMKIKARLAPMSCPQSYWLKTREMEEPEDLPQDIIDEITLLWEDLKSGRAKNQAAKKKMIELYNTIFNANYNPTTNCGSCISGAFDGIKKLYKKYNEY